MGLLDRVRRATPSLTGAARRVDPSSGPALLARARHQYAQAEDEFDRTPQTKATLEEMFATAAEALAAGGHPDAAQAWLGLAEVRRYQKGRRVETLAAFDRALAVDVRCEQAWDAYLDYVTYAARAEDLLEAVRRMPTDLRLARLPWLLSVARASDRWGTMAPSEGAQFLVELPTVLRHLDDDPSLGLVLSDLGLREEKSGSHVETVRLLRAAVATGSPTPAAVDRLTVRMVKDRVWADAASALDVALARPIPSDSMRERLEKRLNRCRRELGQPTARDAPAPVANSLDGDPDHSPGPHDDLADHARPATVSLVPGENCRLEKGTWRATVGWREPQGRFDIDASALIVNASGRVRSDADFIFYNQTATPDRSVVHHGEQTVGTGSDVHEQISVDLNALPTDIVRVVFVASIDVGDFGMATGLHLRLDPAWSDRPASAAMQSDERTSLQFDLPPLGAERAVILAEIYRRDNGWWIRAVGQGYAEGIGGIARDFGVHVE